MKSFNVVSIIVTVLLVFFGILTGCGSKSSDESSSSTDSKVASTTQDSSKKIQLAVDPYPPYTIQNGNENMYTNGFAVEIAKEIFTKIGYEAVFNVVPFAKGIEMMKSGEMDGMMTVYKTTERESFVDYPKESIAPDSQSFFALKESNIKFDGDINNLKGKKIGIVQGYTYGDDFSNAVTNGTVTSETANDAASNLEKLLNNRIDVILDGKYTVLYNLKLKGKLDRVQELTPESRTPALYLVFSKKSNIDKTIIDRYDEILGQMKKDGTWNSIIDKYIK